MATDKLESLIERVEFRNRIVLIPHPNAGYTLGSIYIEDPDWNSPLTANARKKVGEWFGPIVVLYNKSVVMIQEVLGLLFVHPSLRSRWVFTHSISMHRFSVAPPSVGTVGKHEYSMATTYRSVISLL